MSEYKDSLQHSQVVKDAVSINAADECNRLAVENRHMKRQLRHVTEQAEHLARRTLGLYNYLNPKVKDGK